MFWKKKEGEKKLSPQEVIMNQIEQLTEGKSLYFILPEWQWAGGAFIIIELNPKYPGAGQKKYLIFSDMQKDGKPAGAKKQTSSMDNSKDIANLIKTSEGKFFS